MADNSSTTETGAAGEAAPAVTLGGTLAATIAIQASASATVLAMPTIAPLVAADLGISSHLVGYQVSLIYLAGTLASTTAGAMVRRYGPARVSQMALLASAIGLCGLVSARIWLMALSSVVIGLGYALTNPAASDVLNRVTPPAKRNLIFSLKQTGVPLGGVIVALCLPRLSLALGWQAALLLLAACIGLGIIALGAARAGWDAARQPDWPLRAGIFGSISTVLAVPALRSLSFMSFLYSAIQLCLVSFVVVMLVQELHWTPVAAGTAAAAIQTAGIAGRIFWGIVADRRIGGLTTLAIIGLVTGTAALMTWGISSYSAASVVVLLCIFSLASVGWNGVMMAEAARLSPAGAVSTVAGGVLSLTFLGVVTGPAVFAMLFRSIGSYATTFAVAASAPFLGAIIIFLASRAARTAACTKA